MLHIVNQTTALHRCLASMQDNDVILLTQNGVIAGINQIPDHITCYALNADVTARGITDQIAKHIQLISYDQFVDLTIQHHPILTW
jgi:tRNA 2-thiouridine synthesizing protein B